MEISDSSVQILELSDIWQKRQHFLLCLFCVRHYLLTSSAQEIYTTPPPGWYRAEPEICRADQEGVAGVWLGLCGDGAVWCPVIVSQQITAELHLDSWWSWQWGTVHAHRQVTRWSYLYKSTQIQSNTHVLNMRKCMKKSKINVCAQIISTSLKNVCLSNISAFFFWCNYHYYFYYSITICILPLWAVCLNTPFSILTPWWLTFQRGLLFSLTLTIKLIQAKPLTTFQSAWRDNTVAVCVWRSHRHWKHSHILLQASSPPPYCYSSPQNCKTAHLSSRSFYSLVVR